MTYDDETAEANRVRSVLETLVQAGHGAADPRATIKLPENGAATLLFDSGTELGPASMSMGGLPALAIGDEAVDELDLQVLSVLGEGGMGRVDRAVQRSLRREVAVKRLKPRHHTVESRAALLQEALFTGFLEHPNIVPVHLLGRDADGEPVLVMKRVEGVAWSELTLAPDNPHWGILGVGDQLRFHLEVFTQVCHALHFAHSHGILHRDVKPENVMIGHFGEVYLLDWGLALRLDKLAEASPNIVGTPAFMAPEMLDGPLGVTERTDVYLAAATLHEVLTGTPRHDGESLESVLGAALVSRAVDYDDSVPEELARLCNRATSVDPAVRPESALALRLEVEEFLEHRGSIQLADESDAAMGRLRAQIEASAPEPGLLAIFRECRFGYLHALRMWPGNVEAERGLQSVLELMARRALSRGDHSFAQTLVAELPDPRPDLDAKVAELGRALQINQRKVEQFAELQQDLDIAVGARERAWATGVMAIGLALTTGTAAVLRRVGRIEITHDTTTMAITLIFVALAGILLVWRRQLLATTINRRLTGAVGVTVMGVMANRYAAYALDWPIEGVFVFDLLVLAVTLAVTAVTVEMRMMWVAGLSFVGMMGAALWPGYSMEIEAVTLLLGLGILSKLWYRLSRRRVSSASAVE